MSVFLLESGIREHIFLRPDEEIYGTWVNKGGVNSPQKEIIAADGVKKYDKVSDSVPMQEYTKVIDSKWTDSEGNIWYKNL